MKLQIVYVLIILTAACAPKSSDLSVPATTICQKAGIVGTWVGLINNNFDTMTIDANCVASSSYCQSKSNLTLTESTLNQNCPAGTSTCGSGTFVTTESNSASGCSPIDQSNSCSFSVNTTGTSLKYDCGGGAITYSK